MTDDDDDEEEVDDVEMTEVVYLAEQDFVQEEEKEIEIDENVNDDILDSMASWCSKIHDDPAIIEGRGDNQYNKGDQLLPFKYIQDHIIDDTVR